MGPIQDICVLRSMLQSEFRHTFCTSQNAVPFHRSSSSTLDRIKNPFWQHNTNKSEYLCSFCRFYRMITHDLSDTPSVVQRSPSWIHLSSRLASDYNHVHFLFFADYRSLPESISSWYPGAACSVRCFLSILLFCFCCHLIPLLSCCLSSGPAYFVCGLFWSGLEYSILLALLCVLAFSTHAQFLRMRKGGLFLCDFGMC